MDPSRDGEYSVTTLSANVQSIGGFWARLCCECECNNNNTYKEGHSGKHAKFIPMITLRLAMFSEGFTVPCTVAMDRHGSYSWWWITNAQLVLTCFHQAESAFFLLCIGVFTRKCTRAPTTERVAYSNTRIAL